jgi:hypothetical protein
LTDYGLRVYGLHGYGYGLSVYGYGLRVYRTGTV